MRRLLLSLFLTALLAVTGSIHAQVLLRTLPAPSTSAGALTWDGAAFWVGDNTSSIRRVSAVNGAVLKTITGPENSSIGLAWDGANLWVAHGASGSHMIHKIDTASGTVLTTIPDPAAGWLGGLTWQNGQLWATQRNPQEALLTIDPADGSVLATVPVPVGVPWGLTFDDENLWTASNAFDGEHIRHLEVPAGNLRWSFKIPAHSSLDERRLRGMAWVNNSLWFIAFQQSTFELALHEYNVDNAHASDIYIQDFFHHFGDLFVGDSTLWTTNISNLGAEPLLLESATFPGTAFSVTSPASFPVSLNFQQTISLTIQFEPPIAGAHTDILTIITNDPDENSVTVTVQGTGLSNEGNINPVPSPVDFGTIWLPNPTLSSSRTLEIRNVGDGVLTVSNMEITLGSYYSLDPMALPMEIDSHSFANARIWFEPELSGTWQGVLTITSDDADQPELDVVLTGVAEHRAFEAGEIIWQYWGANDNWDNSIDAINWINDVNDDGVADVLASSANGLTFCLNGASSALGDTFWTYNSRLDPNHSGAVPYDRALRSITDITGDGIDDIIIGTAGGNRSVYALSGESGEEIWMFDTRLWDDGGWVNAVEPIGDIDGDFVADVAVAGGVGGTGGPRRIFALSGIDGELVWQGLARTSSFYSVAVINDVTGDGIAEAVGGSSGVVAGYNGATGEQMWIRGINGASGTDSPVFELVRMGNANPDVNTSEDVAVASAYDGIYSIDGQTGAVVWRYPIQGTFVYEVCAGSDITGDDVREVYAGTVSGHVLCIDGAAGTAVWDAIADPVSPENVLNMINIPDVTGDEIDDIACGTLGDYIVVLDGWSGVAYFSTTGAGAPGAIDAIGVLPDIDNNGSWEVLAGNRPGMIQVLAGGSGIPGPEGWVVGTVRSFGPNLPIQNVEVSADGVTGSVFTDASGSYAISLPPETYTIRMQRAGYCELVFDNVVVEEDAITTVAGSMHAINGAFSISSMNVLIQQPQSTTEEFVISNPSGGCELVFSISVDEDWISVDPPAGEVPPNETRTITVTLESADLEAGSYQTTILTEHNDENSPYSITVFMDVISPVSDNGLLLPTEFNLYPAYPNPFNPSTNISYDVASRSFVNLSIYNALGQRIRSLVNSEMNQGHYEVIWNGLNDSGIAAASGIYFVRFDARDYSATCKIALIK
ncbi:choice-of-anchor D domain-containing protein [bacterium]|nr:choice-of-anchor D domain-containing protein [bacterium]